LIERRVSMPVGQQIVDAFGRIFSNKISGSQKPFQPDVQWRYSVLDRVQQYPLKKPGKPGRHPGVDVARPGRTRRKLLAHYPTGDLERTAQQLCERNTGASSPVHPAPVVSNKK
jgi:hypothetical protein